MTRARRFLGLTAALAVALAIAPAAASPQQAPRRAAGRVASPQALGIHGFSVVLVVGTMQGSESGETVPPAARKALADMRDFLPYKRYQLLDAAWMLCCAGFTRSSPSISGRLRGPEQREYAYVIDPIGVAESKINLRFSMREAAAAQNTTEAARMSDAVRLEHSRQLSEAVRERDEAEREVQRTEKLLDVGLVNGVDAQAAKVRYQRANARVADLTSLSQGRAATAVRGATIMDSTFAIAPGETVVIGTSRLMGDQALIALLTAATKPGSSR